MATNKPDPTASIARTNVSAILKVYLPVKCQQANSFSFVQQSNDVFQKFVILKLCSFLQLLGFLGKICSKIRASLFKPGGGGLFEAPSP